MALDDDLLARLKQRDAAAFEEFVQSFEKPLYRFFLCDHRNHHTAEEQTAETFAQLVRALPAMQGEATKLRSFVFATARHVQLRLWRKPRRPESTSEVGEVADNQPSPAAALEVSEEVDRLLAAMRRLDDPLPSVLLLRFVEELSLEEVATALAMPINTVKSHIHRGRLRLKKILADEECKR